VGKMREEELWEYWADKQPGSDGPAKPVRPPARR